MRVYGSLEEITDIAGVRIITYFEDDVQKIRGLIESPDAGFEIDWENSGDKSKKLDPDRFGYRSFHYVLSLGERRAAHTENQRLAGLKCEVQVRSILQHAWAEIEHDIGYKSKDEVPEPVRRRFAQAASFLEVTDEFFNEVHSGVDKYKQEINSETNADLDKLFVDAETVEYFIENEPLVSKVDSEIFASVVLIHTDYIVVAPWRRTVGLLTIAGLNTLQEVRQQLEQEQKTVVTFAKQFLEWASSEGGITHCA